MLVINEGVFRPKGCAYLFARHHRSVCFEQQPQDLERLVLDWYPLARSEKFPAAQDELKLPKPGT